MTQLVTLRCGFLQADAIIEKVGYPDYQFNDTVLEEFYEDVSLEN